MLHYLRLWPRVWSANSIVHWGRPQTFTCRKFSLQISVASVCAIGSSSDSGDRQRRCCSHERRLPEPGQQVFAIIDPVDLDIERRRDRIQTTPS
jgi:hypothetical protein